MDDEYTFLSNARREFCAQLLDDNMGFKSEFTKSQRARLDKAVKKRNDDLGKISVNHEMVKL